jgi:hypothetical protein
MKKSTKRTTRANVKNVTRIKRIEKAVNKVRPEPFNVTIIRRIPGEPKPHSVINVMYVNGASTHGARI